GKAHVYNGAQAEALAVPAADHALMKIPEGMSDARALLLTDILPTGYKGALSADIRPGDSVAVIGCGPVGQMALETAFLFGPARVFAVDQVGYRLAEAERLGATPIDAGKVDPGEAIRDANGGLGPHRVIEAAGPDDTVHLALALVRAGGTVSQVGVNLNPGLPFPMWELFSKDITFRVGLVSPQALWASLLPLLEAERIKPERVFTHDRPMSEGPAAYELFDGRTDGVIKVMLDPAS
ncbi:MAG: zinc-binding dehydrogenase, partial [Dehalococcoidia bacterium]